MAQRPLPSAYAGVLQVPTVGKITDPYIPPATYASLLSVEGTHGGPLPGAVRRRPLVLARVVCVFRTEDARMQHAHARPPSHSPHGTVAWHTIGWRQRWRHFAKTWRAAAVLGELRSKLGTSFTKDAFASEASRLYVDVHSAFALGDLNQLRELVTEPVYADMKRQIDTRNENKYVIHFEMLEAPQCNIVHLNLTRVLNKQNIFAQATCYFQSTQVLALLPGSVDACAVCLVCWSVCAWICPVGRPRTVHLCIRRSPGVPLLCITIPCRCL